jgi:hypothetical protein
MQASYRTATSLIPRRMPLPDWALTQNSSAATARQHSMRHGPSLSQTRAMRQSDFRMSHLARAAHFLAASSYKAPQRAWEARRYAFDPCALRHTLVSNSGHRLTSRLTQKGLCGPEEEAG